MRYFQSSRQIVYAHKILLFENFQKKKWRLLENVNKLLLILPTFNNFCN